MKNSSVFPYADLRDRDLRREGIMIGEGRLVCRRLIKSQAEIFSVLCVPKFADEFLQLSGGTFPVDVREESEIARVAGFKFHRGVLAAARRPEMCHELGSCDEQVVVLCVGIATSENLGSISRTAAALGINTIILDKTCCDPYSRRVLKVCVGAILSQNVIISSLDDGLTDQLHRENYLVVGSVLSERAEPLNAFNTSEKTALVFGTEATGLSEDWISACDKLLTIPMSVSADSLNVGVAAGIILHHFTSS